MALIKKLSKEKIINFGLNTLIGLFSVILLISIYTGVQVKILDHDYANFFGFSMFEVQTESMEEAISPGDWIIVKLNSKVSLNDIITYKKDDNYITHRVVEIHQSTFITKGDANPSKDDKPVDQSQVVGKVTKILSGFGILRKTLFNPTVLILLIIILYLVDSLSKGKEKSNKFELKLKELSVHVLSKLKTKKNKDTNNKIMPELNINNVIEQDLKKEDKLIIEEELKLDLVEDQKEDSINIEEELNKNIINESSNSEIKEVIMPEENLLVDDYEIKTDLDAKEELEEYDYVADELEKTQFFRIIPVDEGELDSTLLEIAEYEMADQNKNSKEVIDKEEITSLVEEAEDDNLTKIDLDLIRKNTRRNKNLIDAIINIKKDEINDIIDHILADEKVQTNEPTIKNILITTFIHARYYNYFSEKDLEYRGKKLLTKIEKILDIISDELIAEYSGNDNKYDEKVKKILNIMKIFNYIDQGKYSITELKAKREYYRNTILNKNKELENTVDEIVNNIIQTQKDYDNIIKYFLKKFETNAFYLDINKIKNQKDYHTVEIEHNISFSKVYSDYIIDKTYTEGIISEDKVSVLFILLLTEVINDMINTDFNKKYIINIPASLFEKEKKLTGLLKTIEDEYAKSHILFLIDLDDLANNKKHIKKLRKSGYRFAVGFKTRENLQSKNRNCLYIGDIIFVNKEEKMMEVLENYIPEDLQNKIIYDDIYDKFNNVEGD